MPDISVKDALRTLTKTEAKVLYLKCRGLKYEEIGGSLDYSIEWVQLHMSNVYRKLGIDAAMHHTKRGEILKQVFCPALAEIVGDKGIDEINWPPDVPHPEPFLPLLPAVIEDRIREELDKSLATVEPIKVISAPSPRITRPRWIVFLGAIISVLSIGLCAFAFWYAINFLRQSPSIGLISTSTNVAIINPTLTEFIPTQTITPSPTTPKPTGTPTPTLEPTFTPTTTYTPEPTSTSTNTPEPTVTLTPIPILFADDFNSGISPQWQVVSGNPIVVNGALSATENTWLVVGNSSWKNYSIEFDGDCSEVDLWWRNGCNVGTRLQDLNNMIYFSWTDKEFLWIIIKNGKKTEISGSYFKTWQWSPPYKVKVIVNGNQYASFINGAQTSSFIYGSFPQGKIGIYIDKDSTVDNFKIISLP